MSKKQQEKILQKEGEKSKVSQKIKNRLQSHLIPVILKFAQGGL